MLEVVEDEERTPVGVVGFGEAECLQGDRQHESRVGQCCQRHEVDSVGELVRELGCDLQSQPGLARAARARDRHEPPTAEQLLHLELLHDAADERVRCFRQVRSVEAPQRWERAAPELIDPLRPRQVLQPVLPEVDEVVRAHQQIAGRVREQHLPAVTGVGDPGGPVHVHADVALLRQQRLPGVDPHSHANDVLTQDGLRCAGCVGCVGCPAERVEERIALGVDLDPLLRLERMPQDRALAFQLVGVRRRPERMEQ